MTERAFALAVNDSPQAQRMARLQRLRRALQIAWEGVSPRGHTKKIRRARTCQNPSPRFTSELESGRRRKEEGGFRDRSQPETPAVGAAYVELGKCMGNGIDGSKVV